MHCSSRTPGHRLRACSPICSFYVVYFRSWAMRKIYKLWLYSIVRQFGIHFPARNLVSFYHISIKYLIWVTTVQLFAAHRSWTCSWRIDLILLGWDLYQKSILLQSTKYHCHQKKLIIPKKGRREGRREGRKEGRKGGRKEGRKGGRKEWSWKQYFRTLVESGSPTN